MTLFCVVNDQGLKTMPNQKNICPSCGADLPEYFGPIPANNAFAGRYLDRLLPGGGLWGCLRCFLVFRHPRMSEDELNRLYSCGHSESWADSARSRADWNMIQKIISSRTEINCILDIGCFDGRLLEFLGPAYDRMGVEIHETAAQKARSRGVKIVAADYQDPSLLKIKADAVLAIDIIEHTYDPARFLERLALTVRKGGIIIVSTGNSSALSWRLMKSRYWYCHIAEHLSFINPSWVARAAPEIGLTVEDITFFSHGGQDITFSKRIYEMTTNLALRFTPKVFAWLRKKGMGNIDICRYPEMALAPPYWMSATDHMLVVFRKK